MPKIPMPSPRGTNRENLFISWAHSPVAAYDAAEGLPLSERVMSFLREKLNATDYAEVEALLRKADHNDHPDPAMDARLRRISTAARNFNERFPDAARIRQVW